MKKSIYLNMVYLSCGTLLLIFILLIIGFRGFFTTYMKSVLINESDLMIQYLSTQENKLDALYKIYSPHTRITVIDTTGEVLFDNIADIKTLDNHLNRPEIIKALKYGQGSSSRISKSLNADTFYYAISLPDGFIIRLSKSRYMTMSTMFAILPMFVILFILCLIVSKTISNKLMNDLESGNSEYLELKPLTYKLKTQGQQLSSQAQFMQNTLENIRLSAEYMQEGLILLDKDLKVQLANNVCINIFNNLNWNYQDKHILEFTRNIDIIEAIELAIKIGTTRLTLEALGRVYEVIVTRSVKDDYLTGIIALFIDNTDKIRGEQIIREFSSNVSHELRTPLTSISGFAELIANNMVATDDIPTFADKICQETSHLLIMIDNILKICCIDEENIEFETFDVFSLIKDVAKMLNPENVYINVQGSTQNIFANRSLIRELLINLLSNSIKYNQNLSDINVVLSEYNCKCVIEVIDHGIGISNQNLERIFERFYRTDKSRNKKIPGTGLGLSIVKSIVDIHSGEIAVESTPSLGTTIRVII